MSVSKVNKGCCGVFNRQRHICCSLDRDCWRDAVSIDLLLVRCCLSLRMSCVYKDVNDLWKEGGEDSLEKVAGLDTSIVVIVITK